MSSPLTDEAAVGAELLTAGQQAGQAKMEELAGSGGGDAAGWSTAMRMFDYNLDRLSLGTIDAPEWKIADRITAYVTRAAPGRAVGQPRL